jgi:putative transcription factor
MICEMCGKEVPYLKKVLIEGTVLNVCSECASFGEPVSQKDAIKYDTKSTVQERLEVREKRRRERDVLEQESVLDPDFPDKISAARMDSGMSQDELAKKINEKHSVIAKIEQGDLVPDENVRKKLEKSLGIKLMVKIEPAHLQKKNNERRGLTLGDLIRMEEK